jgi:hypothetical protein
MRHDTAPGRLNEPVRPRLEVADIFRTHGEHYRENHILSNEQLKTMRNIEVCRTAALGGHVDVCENGCGYMRISYNSCRDRHCPKCQSLQSAKWLDGQLKRMLPTSYFHVVITFPHSLNSLIMHNQRILYSMLFQAAAKSLLELAGGWKRFQAQIGFTAILHTWNQDMLFHPHLHLVVTAGGLDQSQNRWISPKDNFLVPVYALSKKIRGKFVHLLKRAWSDRKLVFRGTMEQLSTFKVFKQFIEKLYEKKWHIHIKRPFAGPEQVFRYVSQYTHRVAISNQRICSMSNDLVTFLARDNDNPGKKRIVQVSPAEFIRRFLLHVLPSGFVKIRHYGLMAPGNLKTKFERARVLIEQTRPGCADDSPNSETISPLSTWQDLYTRLTGVDLTHCPGCGKGRLVRQPLYILDRPHETDGVTPIFLDSS